MQNQDMRKLSLDSVKAEGFLQAGILEMSTLSNV